jgi:undecaprenyl diphosphate synthase
MGKKTRIASVSWSSTGNGNLRRIIKACVELESSILRSMRFNRKLGRPEDEVRGLNQIFNDAFVNEFDELNRRCADYPSRTTRRDRKRYDGKNR